VGELKHWTERSTEDFQYKIGWDFVSQIEKLIDSGETTKASLAEKLGVSKGRVSQVLSNPGNITLKNIVRYARALGKKVSIVAYDDRDPDNHNGPINSGVFLACWERAQKPADFFALNDGTSLIITVQPPNDLIALSSSDSPSALVFGSDASANEGFLRERI
jgi:transcriptional regulator with XRE-family HTH domain